ncbi:MAG: DUF1488 domain-containing protein [Pseudomonadota bacterium]
MQIEFTGVGSYDTARQAVRCPVTVDGRRMQFFIARRVLEDQFGAIGPADLAHTYDANRLEIEMMVRLRIQAGAADGTVLTGDDF